MNLSLCMEMECNDKLEIVLMFGTCLPRSSSYRSVKLYHLVRTNIDIGRFNNSANNSAIISIALSLSVYLAIFAISKAWNSKFLAGLSI